MARHGQSMSRLLNVCLALVLLTPLQEAIAAGAKSWGGNLDITVGHDDNLTQAERGRDQAEDNFTSASIRGGYNKPLGIMKALSLNVFGGSQQHEKFTGLDHTTIGGDVVFRVQNILGFTAPFYQMSLSAQVDNYEVEQRDSTILKAQIFATKRVTDRVSTSIGYEYRDRDSEGTVFDLYQGRIFLNGDYSLNSKHALYGTYSLARGTLESTALLWPDTEYKIIKAARAIEPDAAFSDELGNTWLAYKLKAVTHSLILGYNWAVTGRTALDVSVLGVDVNAEEENEYQRLVARASLLTRF